MNKPLHHSPLFWIGVLLFVGAIGVYVLSDNFALFGLVSGKSQ